MKPGKDPKKTKAEEMARDSVLTGFHSGRIYRKGRKTKNGSRIGVGVQGKRLRVRSRNEQVEAPLFHHRLGILPVLIVCFLRIRNAKIPERDRKGRPESGAGEMHRKQMEFDKKFPGKGMVSSWF